MVDQLTAKLTAKPYDTKGPQRIAMDAYTRPELRRCGRQWPPEQLTSPAFPRTIPERDRQQSIAFGVVAGLAGRRVLP